MYNLKNVTRRASALAGAVTFAASLGVMLFPPGFAAADPLNPLTDRSLTLSSSSPGWSYTDGSGNGTYAPAGTGANGQKTGETFQFNVSTDSADATDATQHIKGLSLQYCTSAAGTCSGPGNDGYNDTATPGTYVDNPDTASTTNLNVVLGSSGGAVPSEMSSGTYTSDFDSTTGALSPAALDTGLTDNGNPITSPLYNNIDSNSLGNFIVLTKDVGAGTWSYSPDWTLSARPDDDGLAIASGSTSAGAATGDMDGSGSTAEGDNNFMQLANSSTGYSLHTGGSVKLIFFGTDDNYITNPGAGAFFVKINDYDTNTTADMLPTNPTGALVDGGVTVANVMNQSIAIQTKVLETMDFSVGTVDPDTLNDTAYATAQDVGGPVTHGECDPILNSLDPTHDAANTLLLGNASAEDSLSTSTTYGTYSYFRLSSNSSAGANIYYSGSTLSDTEGDQINPMGTSATPPHIGTPQFGLALDNNYTTSPGTEGVNYAYEANNHEQGADGAPSGIDASFTSDNAAVSAPDVHNPQLYPVIPETAYQDGTGYFDAADNGGTDTTDFAFDGNSNQIPALLAGENTQVVDCVTGKVRYIANIAATTPAGIYTTKINYIASPQY